MLIKRVGTVKDKGKGLPVLENKPLTHNGVTYNPGDPIAIKGESAKFLYYDWEENKSGKVIIKCWMVNHHWRFLYADRIKGKRKPKPGSLCVDHPTYQAKRKPRSGCERCLIAYESATAKKEAAATKNVGKVGKPAGKIGKFKIVKVEGTLD